jgi:hypothetical protein
VSVKNSSTGIEVVIFGLKYHPSKLHACLGYVL